MTNIYTWFDGYDLHKCDLNDAMKERLEAYDILPIINYLIDTNQINAIEYDNLFDYFENEEEAYDAGYMYFDNTESDVKPGLYYVCIENLKIMEG